MFIIYMVIFIIAYIMIVPFRIFVAHPFKTTYYAVIDFYNYLKHKEWNFMKAGELKCYMAHFGGGKTLTMAHYAVEKFHKYNNKPVWDRHKKKFVTQKIHIISNFDLKAVPYEPLESLSQIVCCGMRNKKIDDENDTRTVVLVLLDEASVQLNSRNFKSNIDPLFLNTLLTSRHYHISLWYSSQKFKLTDALMRSVTQKCVNCNKIWRFLVEKEYEADELEYASDPTMVKPRRRFGFLICNKDYEAYDTLACVGNLKRSVEEGDMMSEQEILEMRGELNPDNDAITHRSFRLKNRRRK